MITTKICSCCNAEKAITEFGKNKQKAGGYHVYCKPCCADKQRAWRSANKESTNLIAKRYRDSHPETVSSINARFREKHKAKRQEYNRKYFQDNREYFRMWDEQNREERRASGKKWREANPATVRASEARRRAQLLQALAEWDEELTDLVTKEAFDLAKRREAVTGFKWHVDHVVPLRGKTVCGLHVWNNFAVIPAEENLKKGNKWLP